jgi:hypothetical protein
MPASIAVELLIFVVGVLLYAHATRASDRPGSIGFWALVAFMLAIYFGSIFGPPPPDVQTLAWTSQAQWLLVGWAYWLDRHRESQG